MEISIYVQRLDIFHYSRLLFLEPLIFYKLDGIHTVAVKQDNRWTIHFPVIEWKEMVSLTSKHAHQTSHRSADSRKDLKKTEFVTTHALVKRMLKKEKHQTLVISRRIRFKTPRKCSGYSNRNCNWSEILYKTLAGLHDNLKAVYYMADEIWQFPWLIGFLFDFQRFQIVFRHSVFFGTVYFLSVSFFPDKQSIQWDFSQRNYEW